MEVYTIGYSSFKLSDFMSTLLRLNIKCLIDVRSVPYSQYRPEYNKETLEAELKKHGIMYRHYANEFGARQNNRAFYGADGILDFKIFIDSGNFQQGVEKIKKGVEMGYSFAFMCAEKDPIDCHRAIMVGRGFKKAGFTVKNIKNDGLVETQEELEQRLLDMYFKDRCQVSFFDDGNDDEKMIEKAYVLRNKDIGYHLESGKEREEFE